MTLASRSLCALTFVAAASAGLVVANAARPGGLRFDAFGFASGPALGSQSIEMGPPDVASVARVTAKSEVIRMLLDDRLTLAEAAAWFRALNRQETNAGRKHTECFPGDSEEERLCRQVISWAKTKARLLSESHEEQVGRRLEGELRMLLSEQGGLRLQEE